MSVSSTSRSTTYVLNQTTSAFNFTWRALTSALTDIKCIITTNSTDQILTYSTDYTVTISTTGVGGTVNLISPATKSKGTLTVYRETTNTQSSDYDDYNQFPANTLEEDLDRRTLVSQEQAEAQTRALLLPITVTGVSAELPVPVATKVIGWDTAGTALQNYTNPGAAASEAQSYANIALGYSNDASASASEAGLYAQTASQIKLSGGSLAFTVSTNTILSLPSVGTLTTETVWADYSATSTVVGWSSFTTKAIYTKKIGKTVFVIFNLQGTSNSTAVTFTLPYASAVGFPIYARMLNQDAGGGYNAKVGTLVILDTENIVTCYNEGVSGNWTDNGGKGCIGEFFYESA